MYIYCFNGHGRCSVTADLARPMMRARALASLVGLVAASALRLPGSTGGAPARTHATRADVLRRAAYGLGALALGPLKASGDNEAVTIGQIPASGIIFKDIVKVERVEDPKVKGVELYISDFQRPITDRLTSDFFSDPAQAAVTCVRVGPMQLADDIDASELGEEVFSQARSLLFKSVNVRRLYDEETGTIVYVSYSKRLNKSDDENKSRFKTTMCALKIEPPPPRRIKPQPPSAEPAPAEPPPAPPPSKSLMNKFK